MAGMSKMRRPAKRSKDLRTGSWRPKLRWEDGVMDDARKLAERNWRNVATNRDSWRKLLTKTLTQNGLLCQWWWRWFLYTQNVWLWVLASEPPLLRNIVYTLETLNNFINTFSHPEIFRLSRKMPEDVCTVCSRSASNRCSACKQVSYCSREHQKQDWRNHKDSCRPFEASIISS